MILAICQQGVPLVVTFRFMTRLAVGARDEVYVYIG